MRMLIARSETMSTSPCPRGQVARSSEAFDSLELRITAPHSYCCASTIQMVQANQLVLHQQSDRTAKYTSRGMTTKQTQSYSTDRSMADKHGTYPKRFPPRQFRSTLRFPLSRLEERSFTRHSMSIVPIVHIEVEFTVVGWI